MNTASRRKKSKSSSNETYMKLSGWSKAAVLGKHQFRQIPNLFSVFDLDVAMIFHSCYVPNDI